MNFILLIGRIKEMPNFEQTNNGLTFCHLLIETMPTDEKQPETYSVTLWKTASDLLKEKGSKGAQVCIKGRLRANNFVKEDGTTNYRAELVADKIMFIN